MKYMLMFWEDESSPDDGAPSLAAIRSWVDGNQAVISGA
jgi:hypothetical protein